MVIGSNMYINIFLFLLLLYFLYQLDKRLRSLEEKKVIGESQSFLIDAHQSVLYFKPFGKITGLKEIEAGVKENKLSDKELDKFGGLLRDGLHRKLQMRITYLASENAFYIQHAETSGLVLINEVSQIFNTIICGDFEGINANVSFGIMHRVTEFNGVREPVISGYLREDTGNFKKEGKFLSLFDLPFSSYRDMEYYKQLGFKAEEDDSDFYTDYFGDSRVLSSTVTLSKNGVTINI